MTWPFAPLTICLQIVCKFFIEAIETQKFVFYSCVVVAQVLIRCLCRFGWFWECPNGGEKCQYRHALPPGFVLKSQRKAAEEAAKANEISLEDFLEVEVRLLALTCFEHCTDE